MPDDRRVTISSNLRIDPAEIPSHSFRTTRKGFDPTEVRAFLDQLARELIAARDHASELAEALQAAEQRAANPAIDEATLTAALGQETARVLRSAHEAAAEIATRAESEAAELRSNARAEVESLRAQANQELSALRDEAVAKASDELTKARSAAADIRRRAEHDAASAIDAARSEAESITARARSDCRSMVQEAQELRSRVLADLTKRRRLLHGQIDQLRAGRDRLAAVIGSVRSAVERIDDDLASAEEEAQVAADSAARSSPSVADLPEALLETRITPEERTTNPSDPPPDAQAMSDQGTRRDTADPEPGMVQTSKAGESTNASSVEEPRQHPLDEAQVGGIDPDAVPDAVGDVKPRKAAKPRKAGTAGTAGTAGATAATAATAAEDVFARLRAARQDAEELSSEREPAADRHEADILGEPDEFRDASKSGESGERGDSTPDPETPEHGSMSFALRRSELLDPVVSSLARRLKRALQDDQNDFLDRLRHAGRWQPDILPDASDHEARFAAASRPHLLEAAKAGARFAEGGATHSAGVQLEAPGAVDDEAVNTTASALAVELTSVLRKRITARTEGRGDHDEDTTSETVSAAYREWKGARIERLAQDHATSAFFKGALAVAPPGTVFHWDVGTEGSPCPDCEDNALAGGIAPGDSYPTGHPHPPAHPGCCCLIVPATA